MKRKHYLLIAALSLSLTTGAAAATLAACGKEPPTIVELTPYVTGIYYVEDGGIEKTINIGISSFTLNFGEGEKSGVYGSYANGTLQLTFDNGDTATAAFNDGKMTLNYKGKTYTLYLSVNYTVSFNVDGGSAIEAQTVKNGKTATRPATNPTRDNSIFVGWYTDGTFATEFDFSAPITGNTTVYAKFITIDATLGVYTATFDLGNGVDESYGTVKTANRVLYNLPEAPSKDGNKFLGWWMSNYYDGAKLSTKYEGQEIYEDVVLYAVWASDTPAISVTKSGATWSVSGSNKTFDVSIKDSEGNVLASNKSASTSIDFDFSEADAGDYTVEVTVDGKTAVAYYKNKALARVGTFAVEDDYLGFLPIEAEDPYLVVEYYIDFVCGDAGHHHEHQKLEATGYDFSACAIGTNGYKVRITAESAGYASSTSEWYEFDRTLDGVTGFAVDATQDLLKWNAVAGAKSYSLKISSGTKEMTLSLTDNFYDLRSLNPGDWSFEITPVNNTYHVPQAATAAYTKTRLASPALTILDDAITWEEVEGATGYEVYINGELKDTLESNVTTFPITDDLFGEEATEYAVTVVAKADNALNNSLASDAVYIHGQLGEISYADGEVSWGAVKGIVKYGVKVGDAEEIFVNTNHARISFTQDGNTTITVTCYVNGTQAADTNTTDVMVYAVVFETNGGTRYPAQYKAAGDTVTLPAAPSRIGYTFLGWYDLAENGNQYTEDTFTLSASAPTVYAHWEALKFTVTLVVGANGKLDDGVATEYEVTFGEKSPVPLPVPECLLDGKEFMGWFTSANGGIQITDNLGYAMYGWNLPQNTTLYAQWGNSGVLYELLNDHEYVAKKGEGVNNLSTVTVLASYKGLPVTTLAADAFDGCTSVTTLRIPSSLRTVMDGANGPYTRGSSFYGLTSLLNIEVYDVEGERFFASVDGSLYTVSNDELNELIYVPRKKNITGSTFRVADGTKSIGYYVLSSMGEIAEVVIPSSVTNIADSAFSSDYKLTKVTFLPAPNGEMGPELTIGASFRYCTGLREITFPKRLTTIHPEIFGSTTSPVPMENIYVQELGTGKDRNTNFYDIDGVLCKADEIVLFPRNRAGSYQTPSGIKRIGEAAFKSNTAINSVRFLATVEEIGIDAFSGCSNLLSISFDQNVNNNDLKIRERAFYNCSRLTGLILPPNLQTLEANAFGYTSALTSVTVNTNRTNINFANNAFATTLANAATYLEVLYLGENVPELNLTAVFGTKLREVHVADGNPNYIEDDDVIYNSAGTEILFFPDGKTEFTIGDMMTTIGAGLFKNKTSLEKVTIGANVRTIEVSAFEGCTGLETLIFLEGTQSLTIGEKAFYDLKALKNLEFNGRGGEEIFIGANAFASSTIMINGEFHEITLPEGVKTIGRFAFANRDLHIVNLPASLEEMGMLEVGDQYPLAGTGSSYQLKSIGVANISIFAYCGQIKEINVSPDNTHFASIDGVLFAKEENVITTLLYAGRNNVGGLMPEELRDPDVEGDQYGYLAVPETVTKIADFAFYYNQIKVLEFKGTHTQFTLGNSAFQYSRGLEKISLPSGLTEISEGLFNGCSVLAEIEIPNTVTLIKQKAFSGCSKLTKVTFAEGNDEAPLVIEDGTTTMSGNPGSSGGVSTVKTGAFGTCPALKEIIFPARLESIGTYTFDNQNYDSHGSVISGTTALTTVVIPITISKIGEGAFRYCKNLTTITFTGTLPEDGATELAIEKNTFYNCTSLEEIKLPANVTSIGDSAFYGATKFTTINFPEGLTTISASAFYRCPLNSIDLPESVTTLGANAFYGAQIAEITIPSKLTTLAALGISTLESVHFATYEKDGKQVNDLETISSAAFSGLADLTLIELEKCTSLKVISANAFAKTGLTEITVPYGVTEFGVSAFENSTKLKTLKILTDNGKDVLEDGAGYSTLKTIGNYAFRYTAIGKFAFPTLQEGELSLGMNLFEGCYNLTDLHISASVKNIGGAINKAPNLENITVADGAGVIVDVANRLLLTAGTNNTYIISSAFSAVPLDKTGKFTVPEKYNGGYINTIGEGAFAGQNAMKIVSIPAAIMTIGTRAFSQCRGLEKVEFADDTLLTTIGDYAFEHTYSLKTVTIPNSVHTLGQYVFQMSQLREATMPNELQSIGNYVFAYAANLESVYNVSKYTGNATTGTTRGAYMFTYCTSLKNVTFAEGADSLFYHMFESCTSLEKIDLTGITKVQGNNTTVAQQPFYNTTSLKEVILDANYKELAQAMFYNCTALETIYRSDKYHATDGTAEAYRAEYAGKADLSQVTKLGADGSSNTALYKCISLKEIDARNLTTLTKNVFSQLTSLKKVIISGNYASLTESIFDGCTALETVQYWNGAQIVGNEGEVTLNGNLEFLGTNAFQNSGIKKITIPEAVTMLGTAAKTASTSGSANTFKGCFNLKEVVLPSGLTKMAAYVFQNCPVLDTIYYTGATRKVGEVQFPAHLDQIGNSCFNGCSALPSVDLSTIATFGTYAFQNCTSMKEVTGLKTSANYLFKGCTALEKVTLPSGITSIGSGTYLFQDCTSLKTVENFGGITSISTYMFQNCKALENIDISKVTSIGNYAFDGAMQGENSVTLDLSAATSIGQYAFRNCTAIQKVENLNKPTLATYAFSGCTSLESIDLSKVTSFGTNCFQNCSSLKEIDLSAASTMQAYMFDGCTSLHSVTLGDKITSLANYMFRNCESLESIDLNNVTSIGTYVFNGCTQLSDIDVSGCTSIGADAFYNCSSLASLTLNENLTTIPGEMLLNCYSLETLTIPASVTSIGNNLFVGCTKLKITVDPDNQTFATNEQGVLYNKTNGYVLFIPYTALGSAGVSEIILPEGSNITAYMFNGYADVTRVQLPSDLTEIPAYAFWNFKGSLGADFTIPAGVTSIGNYAFYNMPKLEELVIPEGVTSIGQYAFANSAIKKITLPSTLTKLDTYAFSGCKNLVDVLFSGDTIGGEAGLTISNYSFQNTTSLGNLVLPEGVVKIGTGTTAAAAPFTGSGIKSLTLPSTLTAIAAYSFQNCTELTTVTFAATVAEGGLNLGNYAFSGCSSLSSVTLPDGLTTLYGTYLFSGTALTSIKLPTGLTTITANAFENCALLTEITIPYTVKTIGANAFHLCSKLTTVNFEATPDGVEEVGLEFSNSTATSVSPDATYGYIHEVDESHRAGFKGTFVGTAITSITLPSRTTTIGAYMFIGLDLKSFTIPVGVTTIGLGAFMYTPLTSITIPYTVTSLGNNAFAGCVELSEVIFQDTPEDVEPVKLTGSAGGRSTTFAATHVFLFETDGNYYSGLFAGDVKLTEISIPSRMASTADYMFAGCTGLTTVHLTEGTTALGSYSFTGCSSMKELILPLTVKAGTYAFHCWTPDQKVLFDISDAAFLATSDLWANWAFTTTHATFGVTGYDYSKGSDANG